MTTREFYTVAEAAELLGCDIETVRQQIALNRFPVCLELRVEDARWVGLPLEVVPTHSGHTQFSSWAGRLWNADRQVLTNKDRDDADSGSFHLWGWFLLDPFASRGLAVAPRDPSDPESDYRLVNGLVSPLCGPGDDPLAEQIRWRIRQEMTLDRVRLRDSDLTGQQQLKQNVSRWPWGDYTTDLLEHLAAAGERWGPKFYDPSDHTTAPTNEQIEDLLEKRGVTSKTMREKMATILRDQSIPPGPRK